MKHNHNFPPDHREQFIAWELHRIVVSLCAYHGLEQDAPFVTRILRAIEPRLEQVLQEVELLPNKCCELCGMDFKPINYWQRFCNDKCLLENYRGRRFDDKSWFQTPPKSRYEE